MCGGKKHNKPRDIVMYNKRKKKEKPPYTMALGKLWTNKRLRQGRETKKKTKIADKKKRKKEK